MKIALLNDTHAGLKNSSDIFLDYSEKFYSEVFFPYCLENGIKKIIHLGDYLDHRKYVNFRVLRRSRKMFLEKLREYGMHMTIIPGNHDVYYKDTNALCGLKEVLGGFQDVVQIIMKPTDLPEETGLAVLPWLTEDNIEESLEFCRTTSRPILLSHLELVGFEMMKGMPVSTGGMAADVFAKFEMVLSGHYHTKSSRGNVHYLGTQFEHTWADCDDPKFFHILDTTTRELTAIRNPHRLFQKFIYDDGAPLPDVTSAAGAFVKVIVVKKSDPEKLDRFIEAVTAAGAFEVKVLETYEEFSGENVGDENVNVEDTHSLLNSYVEAVETELDKSRLKSLLQELYVEAQNREIV